MNSIESTNKNNLSVENINKIFETQKKNLNKDILFLKEECLSDFRQIETKLNSKYDKQNFSVVTRLEKFENVIAAMNTKIIELSKLISTDKNIQQKVSQLYEFKTKIEDDFIKQNESIKIIARELKAAINNYDTLISNSIVYQGVIGPNSKFATFHELIDFILLNINQLSSIKDKNILDFKSYKSKLESLVKSFKIQADSIMSNTHEFTNQKIDNFEKKFQNLLSNHESKIFDIKMENTDFISSLEKKIDKLNSIYIKNGNDVNTLKDFNKVVVNEFDKFQNEIDAINNKLNNMKGEIIPEDLKKNSSQYARTGMLAKSIIKKYIAGEVGLKDIEHPLRRQKTIISGDNDMKNNFTYYNRPNNYSFNKLTKRMTCGPKIINDRKNNEKSFVNNKYLDNSIYSEKSLLNKSNNNNCINEEKDEDVDYINIYKEKTNEDKGEVKKEVDKKIINENIKENEKENEFSDLYEDIDINNDTKPTDIKDIIPNKENIQNKKEIKSLDSKKYSEMNKDLTSFKTFYKSNKKDEAKKYLMKNNNTNNNNETMKNNSNENIIFKEAKLTNTNSKYESTNIFRKERKDKYRAISCDKEKYDINNESFPKIGYNNNLEKFQKKKKLFSASKFNKIENNNNEIDNSISNYMSNTQRSNKASVGVPDNSCYSFRKTGIVNNLNIIEIQFDETNSSYKENGAIKKIINNIKDIEGNPMNEKNRSYDKHQSAKKIRVNNSDMNFERRSPNKIVINESLENNYYNMMVKDDSQKYSTLGYLNYIQKNRIDLKKKRINVKKK